MVSLSHDNRHKQRTAKMLALEDCASARHQDRVLVLGGELNGPSRHAYIFSWQINSVRALNEPVCSTNLSPVIDNFCNRFFKNFFAHSNAAGNWTSFGPEHKGCTVIVQPTVVGRLRISDWL